MVDGFDPKASQAMDLTEVNDPLQGGAAKKKPAKKAAKKAPKKTEKGAKKAAKKPAKKTAKKPAKKTAKRPPSKWILHVKAFAKANNCSYREALSNSKCKSTYKK